MSVTPTVIWNSLVSSNLRDFSLKFYTAILNNHASIFHFIASFFLNFAPVAIWLALFKNASLIPISWRPKINVKWLPLADAALFNPSSTQALIFLPLYAFSTCLLFKYLHIKNKLFYLLTILAIPTLNILNYQVAICEKTFIQDLSTYTSYVLLHLIVPIITAVYLYACHLPGVLALYGRCLGLQNIASIATHISIPSSPPWFVHINGINATADYSTLGYAAELARIDTELGWHLVSNGFHHSPIVFGAFPSVHSGMAVCTFLFIAWFSTLRPLKALAAFFVVLQWWSTIYLDHHWRLDLLAGATYSISAFLLLRHFSPDKFATAEFSEYHKLTSSDVEMQLDEEKDVVESLGKPFLHRLFL